MHARFAITILIIIVLYCVIFSRFCLLIIPKIDYSVISLICVYDLIFVELFVVMLIVVGIQHREVAAGGGREEEDQTRV